LEQRNFFNCLLLKGDRMLRRIFTAAFFILFAVSLAFNVLSLAGCFQKNLLREKDEIVARFTRRVEELEQANKRLAAGFDAFEKKLEAYEALRGQRDAAFRRIMDDYRALKSGVSQ
jgi:hypothetical protein